MLTPKPKHFFLLNWFVLHILTGRGVFAATNIPAGEFLLQYDGELISSEEGDIREETLENVYRYFFTSGRQKYW